MFIVIYFCYLLRSVNLLEFYRLSIKHQ